VRPQLRLRSHVRAGNTRALQETGERQKSLATGEIAEEISFQRCATIQLIIDCGTDLVNRAVLLSEAKHLGLFREGLAPTFDQRFFAPLRMTFATRLWME
jgi:hypothetical protein